MTETADRERVISKAAEILDEFAGFTLGAVNQACVLIGLNPDSGDLIVLSDELEQRLADGLLAPAELPLAA